MNLIYEIQGNSNYLVYQLKKGDEMDQVSCRMVTGNHIEGVLPTTLSWKEDGQCVLYQISSKISLKQFIINPIKKEHLLNILTSIAKTVISVDNYMLDSRCFLYDLDYIYVDLSTFEVSLTYLPIIRNVQELNIKLFLKELLFELKYNLMEDCNYVARLITLLNSGTSFNFNELHKILQQLMQKGEEVAATEEVDDSEKVKIQKVEIQDVQKESVPVHKVAKEIDIPVSIPQINTPVKEIERETQEIEKKKKGFINSIFKKDAKSLDIKNTVQEIPVLKKEKNKKPVPEIPNPKMPIQNAKKNENQKKYFLKKEDNSLSVNIKMQEERKESFESEFGQTVIIGGAAVNNDNTVLAGVYDDGNDNKGDKKPQGHLIRKKTKEKIILYKDIFHIGKVPEFSDYCITDNKTISKTHACIERIGDVWYIKDVNSLNHTFINDEMIMPNTRIALTQGTKIRLSDEEFEFRLF